MREVVLRVPRAAVEDVLDRLLLIVPGGVREVPAGRHVDLKVRGEALPALEELRRAVGRWPHRVSEHEISDDWRERRAADYIPEVIGDRLVVRPDWAPPSGAEIEIVLAEGAAFGAGTHPTTRACLELLLEVPPSARFADLGCGSGVLAILAAKLGWRSVVAVDIDPVAVAAARENAAANHAAVEVREASLTDEPPPRCGAFVANVLPELHAMIASAWEEPVPQTGLLSGFGPGDAEEVLGAYLARGMREERRVETHGWMVVLVARG